MPSYSIVDLRAGVETHHWSVALYVKNVGDVIAFSSVAPLTSAGNLGPQEAAVFRPRTIGLTLSAKF
jgi:outer membrane receptor protein involved in Fe transport